MNRERKRKRKTRKRDTELFSWAPSKVNNLITTKQKLTSGITAQGTLLPTPQDQTAYKHLGFSLMKRFNQHRIHVADSPWLCSTHRNLLLRSRKTMRSSLWIRRSLSNLFSVLGSYRKESDLQNAVSKNSCYLHTLYFSKECHLTINAALNKGNVRNVSLVGVFVSHVPCFDQDLC